MGRIKVVGRFVKKDDIRIFQQHFRQDNLGTLAATHLRHHVVLANFGQAQPVHDPLDFSFNIVEVIGIELFLNAAGPGQQAVVHLRSVVLI